MTIDPVSVTPSTCIRDLIDHMLAAKIDHIIVAEEKVLQGIVSKTDIYKYLLQVSLNSSGKKFTEKTLKSVHAQDVMTSYPVTLTSNQPISVASNLFLKGIFHAIPIVDDNKLVGIVTARDLLTDVV